MISLSYTCGAQWRTCACTEDDQARRTLQIRENLAKQEAEAQAEEEEIRAAIAAVEEAERQAAEERRERERQEEEARAEEARQIAVREFERVEKINQKFDRLRKILIHIHSQQSEVLTQRHAKQMKEIETKETELEATFAESKDIQKDRARIVSETESQIQELRKKHTAQLIQTRSRHRKDEDDCLLIFSGETEGNHTPDPGSILEALLSAQELERVTLRNIQAREVSKCKDRGDMSLWFFDERVRREGEDRKGRYERRRADLVEEVKGLKRGQWADWKWMELVKGERTRMLGEDEWRVILGGGEVGGKEGGKEEVDLWWLGS
ncbi:MAG: hypothetical protein L6R41_003395 [Letrouitia leprolyta]|nr:MAG: hypothetical protein L6R41_003395 [Letrouitia leprolyta]